uniref:Uncharacterized protein n=1 Tax=Rhizophora mucronata TaxID=61149 RepID=A0A2P2NEP8_RHIMU
MEIISRPSDFSPSCSRFFSTLGFAIKI